MTRRRLSYGSFFHSIFLFAFSLYVGCRTYTFCEPAYLNNRKEIKMAKIIKEITLDVVRDNAGCTVSAKQNDANSRFIRVKITADRKPIKVDKTATVMINAMRPDGQSGGFVGEVNDDGTVTAPLTEWMLMQSGAVKCDISVFDGAERLTTMPFFIAAEECLYNGEGIENDENYTVLISLMEEVQEIRAEEMRRAEAEASRVGAEEERVFSENQRASAETVRETNEASREIAEGLREVAETLREESEEDREASEIARKAAESERANAENERHGAEERRTVFIPSVSNDGVISWSNDKGLENPSPVDLLPAIISGVLNALPSAEGGAF